MSNFGIVYLLLVPFHYQFSPSIIHHKIFDWLYFGSRSLKVGLGVA